MAKTTKPNPLVAGQNASVAAARINFEVRLDVQRTRRNAIKIDLLASKLTMHGYAVEAQQLQKLRYAAAVQHLDPAHDPRVQQFFKWARRTLPPQAAPHQIWPLSVDVPGFLNATKCWRNFLAIVSRWSAMSDIDGYRLLFITINRQPWGKILTHADKVAAVREDIRKCLLPHKVWSGWFFDASDTAGNHYPHYHLLYIVPVDREGHVDDIINTDFATIARNHRVKIHVAHPDRVDGLRDCDLRSKSRRQNSWFITAAYCAGIFRSRPVPRNQGRTPTTPPVQLSGYWDNVPPWPSAWRSASLNASRMTTFDKALFPFLVIEWLWRNERVPFRRQNLTQWCTVRPLRPMRSRQPASTRKSGPNAPVSASCSSVGRTGVAKRNKRTGAPPKMGRKPVFRTKRQVANALGKAGSITGAARILGVAIDTAKRLMRHHGL